MIALTIIVPVFNEVESLPQFKVEMNKFLEEALLPSEVLFINDGSTDGSDLLIQSICHDDSRYHYITLRKNYGLSTAIKAGIDHIDTPLTGYIDADLQTSPSDFNQYFEFLDTYSMINGIRKNRNDGFIKRISSKIANSFRRWMINDGITDTCCPLKIVQTDIAKSLPFFKGMHRFMPALVQLQGGNVKQIEVQHFARFAGTAKYHLWNRLLNPFLDTLAFRWMRKRYIRYETIDQIMTTTYVGKGVLSE